jgi:hypothetical protein
MINEARLQVKIGSYRFASSAAVTDRMLLDVAAQFENDIVRKIAAITPEHIHKHFASTAPVLATTKYDGEGVFVYFERDKWMFAFNTPSGRVRLGLPVLDALAARLSAKGIARALFRCELYLPALYDHPTRRRATISDVIHVSFHGPAEKLAALKLAMLDITMLDGKDLRANKENFAATWELLDDLFGADETTPFHRPAGSIVPEKAIRAIFDELVARGAEGLVIRRLQRFESLKIKPHLSVDAVVIGCVAGEHDSGYGISSLLMALSYPAQSDGSTLLHAFCRVGSGFTDAQRVELLSLLAPLQVEAPLAMTDADGRSINFIKPQHLAELHGEDFVSSTSQNRENRSQVFSTDGSTYTFRGLAPLPRMTFATFNRMRPDKSLSDGGARISQVCAATTPALPAPVDAQTVTTIRREVYAKGEAVRKLLLLQQPNGSRLPYLVYWTDYSAKRKEPLKVDLVGAHSLERAEGLAERLLKKNITKGSERISAAAEASSPASPLSPATAPAETANPKTKSSSPKSPKTKKPASRSRKKSPPTQEE